MKKPTGPTIGSALQDALAAEHAAVYGYGVVGAMVGKAESRARPTGSPIRRPATRWRRWW